MNEAFSAKYIRNIDANRTIKDELTTAIRSQSARRRISVTDLVNPRQAFFRWTKPEIQPSPERAQTMLAGTGFHALFGMAISTEEFVEQFVEFEGIVGKIDIYEDVPVELKTTSSIPQGADAARPSYVDQLSMYCAMSGALRGRLIVYGRERFGRPPHLRAFRLEFTSLDPIKAEMFRRRDLLRRALETQVPSGLPRCEWFDRGCDYRDICGCEAAEPLTRVVQPGMFTLEPDPELESVFSKQPNAAAPDKPTAFRLNDLVFPRKAAYERLQVPEDEEDEVDDAVEGRLRDLERRGLRGSLYKALHFGIPGAFRNEPVRLRSLLDRVGTYKGTPTLLRVSRLREMVERDRLPYAMSHYFDRLAFECALAGHDYGRVVLFYEYLGDKFMVYDVGFKEMNEVFKEADGRLGLLESGASPDKLPPCPSWMYKNCEFAPHCGCGGVPA